MWQAQVFTLYPEVFPGPLSKGLYGKAMSKKLWDLKIVNIRDAAEDKHKTVDDTPYGGGSGMLLKADVLAKSLDQNISSYDQQSTFVNLEFVFSEIWNNDATKHGLSFGWLINDDANIFHKGGNVDCFRVMFGTTMAKELFFYGAVYFDKDESTGNRHDLPAIGFRYGW